MLQVRLDVDARRRKIERKLHKATRDYAYNALVPSGAAEAQGESVKLLKCFAN